MVKINTAKLNKAIAEAFDKTVERVDHAFDEAITSEIYDYPRKTLRRNSDVVGSPRDIVDLGNLHDSKSVARAGGSDAAEFSWSVEYAAAVHFGYTTKTGLTVPPRPWTEKGLEICNPAEAFAEELGRQL